MNNEIVAFTKAVHNLLDSEAIPKEAFSDAKNFVTKDGKVILIPGRNLLGAEGAVGKITGLYQGYKVDGTIVKYAKFGTKIKYFDGSAWQDCITGLTESAEYVFANYASLSGAFTIAIGIDGIWKFVNSHPTSPISMYNPGRNFRGKLMIDRGRSILWDRDDPNKKKDATGIYLSWIDRQNSTIYTSVKDEAIGALGATTYTGTLAFKGNSGGKVFTAANLTNIFTSNTHGLVTGDEVKVGNAAGALPTGLDNSTIYFIQKIDANTFYLIDINGQIVDITSDGSGTNTVYYNGSRKNCFGVVFKAMVAAGIEIFTESYNGILTGSRGGTGTIDYATGIYSVTFSAITTGAVTADYQHENSNFKGILDFTYSATRQAGEGAQFPQDQGGDAILRVLLGQDGAYYSGKKKSFYRLALDADDTGANNEPYRIDIGLPSFRCAVTTNKGIVFINTANPSKPEMTILQKNPIGDTIEPYILFPHFKFGNYDFSDGYMDTYDRWTMVFCKRQGSINNDIILMCNMAAQTIDIVNYSGRMAIQDSGNLYVGDSLTQTIYQIFNGYDDLGLPIDAHIITKSDTFNSELLKKIRRLRLRGNIGADQSFEVYINFDYSGFQLVGTIKGSGDYVDYTSSQAIGTNFIGESQIGGGSLSPAYPFFTELKIKCPKFRTREIKIVPKGIGYLDLDSLMDWDVLSFEARLPKNNRQKQNVSLSGATNQ